MYAPSRRHQSVLCVRASFRGGENCVRYFCVCNREFSYFPCGTSHFYGIYFSVAQLDFSLCFRFTRFRLLFFFLLIFWFGLFSVWSLTSPLFILSKVENKRKRQFTSESFIGRNLDSDSDRSCDSMNSDTCGSMRHVLSQNHFFRFHFLFNHFTGSSKKILKWYERITDLRIDGRKCRIIICQ